MYSEITSVDIRKMLHIYSNTYMFTNYNDLSIQSGNRFKLILSLLRPGLCTDMDSHLSFLVKMLLKYS